MIREFPYLELTPGCIDHPEVKSFMEMANLKVAEKISSSEGCIGVVCLGEKLNKSEYTEDDVEFLGLYQIFLQLQFRILW